METKGRKAAAANQAKATGIVRKVDELGRIVLPVELRRTLEINERDDVEIYVDGSSIILNICPRCLKSLKNLEIQ